MPADSADPALMAMAVASGTFAFAAWLSYWLGNTSKMLLVSIIVVIVGATTGIAVREVLFAQPDVFNYTPLGFLIVFLVSVGFWLWNQLSELTWHISKRFVDTLAAFAASFVIAISLVPLVVDVWNASVGRVLTFAVLSNGSDIQKLLDRLQELAGTLDSLSGLLTAIIATAGATYVVTMASPQLEAILSYLQLSPPQVNAAHKLRRPLSDLVQAVTDADLKFKRELVITMDSFERESPIESGTSPRGARIKIVVPPPGSPPHAFSFTKISELLERAHVDIRESLFFVYPMARSDAGPICYATGPELWELMQSPARDDGMPGSGRFRGAFSDSFFGALNSGNAEAISIIVDKARDSVLRGNPQDDLLLCTYALSDTCELTTALREMRKRGLRRALVFAPNRAPTERAILGIPHIAAYLWNENGTED
ncbi:MAG: hypothetical protein K8S25_10135 [Alphaproteobacteria bacterium]|nr:hypothetical protein [Alphaproteobacteria bacterium]